MNVPIRYIDLFCGIGGFHIAMDNSLLSHGLKGECVFASDIDEQCRRAYAANFGQWPFGDITAIDAESIPDHDVLLAGFPCQPFSIIGSAKGFEDTRGTLFFEIARILETKRPAAFVLENVKQLVGHDGGRTFSRILETIDDLGYTHAHRIFNALDFGLPQKRERVFIVGFRETTHFDWPLGGIAMKPLSEILESNVSQRHFASERIREQRRAKYAAKPGEPTIWHENKSGHIGVYPFSCALRAGASYNYLLVNGERRLTPREMLRLQGFPDSYKIVCEDSHIRKQCGNAVAVPVVNAVLNRVLDSLRIGSLSATRSYMEQSLQGDINEATTAAIR